MNTTQHQNCVSRTVEWRIVRVPRFMTTGTETNDTPTPIDEEAAEIDARSPDAAKQIEELIEHAHELAHDAQLPGGKSD